MDKIRRDTETKNLRKTILKYSKDIPVAGQRYRGVFSIIGYRVYDITGNTHHREIDIVFNGEICVIVATSNNQNTWCKSDIKTDKSHKVSPVKLGRFLRKSLLTEINQHLAYFSVSVKNDWEIKKIKWI
jgi:hypothetical protein